MQLFHTPRKKCFSPFPSFEVARSNLDVANSVRNVRWEKLIVCGLLETRGSFTSHISPATVRPTSFNEALSHPSQHLSAAMACASPFIHQSRLAAAIIEHDADPSLGIEHERALEPVMHRLRQRLHKSENDREELGAQLIQKDSTFELLRTQYDLELVDRQRSERTWIPQLQQTEKQLRDAQNMIQELDPKSEKQYQREFEQRMLLEMTRSNDIHARLLAAQKNDMHG